jgi:hypothetical protein
MTGLTPHMRAAQYERGITFPCPVCGTRARSCKSESVSRTLRALKFQCTNVDCGHTWLAHLEFVRTLSPSAFGAVTRGEIVPKIASNSACTRPLTETRPPGGA